MSSDFFFLSWFPIRRCSFNVSCSPRASSFLASSRPLLPTSSPAPSLTPPPPVPPLRSGVFKARRQKSTASLQLVKYRFYCLWDLACCSVHLQRYNAHSHTAECVCAHAVSHDAASTLKRFVFHSALLPFVITLSCLAAVKRQGEAISEG